MFYERVLYTLTLALGLPQEGQDYLGAMAAAANYAWVNRASMTFLTRQAFAKAFRWWGGGGGARGRPRPARGTR